MLDVICTRKMYTPKEYKKKFKSEINTWYYYQLTKIFMRNKNARVMTLDEVKNSDGAYFEFNQHYSYIFSSELFWINLSNIMVGYQITDTELIAYKVWHRVAETKIEEYKFLLKNYGSTWRCWSAVPTVEQIRQEKWQ